MKPQKITLRDKIRRLHEIGDVALYRWTTGRTRIAKDYVMLSMLRLDVLSCTKDYIRYSSSAPCLFMQNGRPDVQMWDHGILYIIDGPRGGMHVTSGMLRDNESAAEARHCTSLLVDEDHCEKWLERKVMSMGLSPVHPVSRIITPELSRISKKSSALKPRITNELKHTLGCPMNASAEEIIQKFQQNLTMFGQKTDEGWVVAYDHIVTGGCIVATAKGITAGSSLLYQMPLAMFQLEVANRHWLINTRKEN